MIRFFCRSCWYKISAKPEQVGKKVKCPKCGEVSYVPAAGIRPTPSSDGSQQGQADGLGAEGSADRQRRRPVARGDGYGEDADANDLSLSATRDTAGAFRFDTPVPPAGQVLPSSAGGLGPPPGAERGTRAPGKRAARGRAGDSGKRRPARRTRTAADAIHTPASDAPDVAEVSVASAAKGAAPVAEISDDLAEYAKQTLRRRTGPMARPRSAARRLVMSVPVIAVAASVLVGLLVAIPMLLRSGGGRTWEARHREQILSLSDAAQELRSAGRLQEAAMKYADLLRQVGDHPIADGELEGVIARCRRDLADVERELTARRKAESERQVAKRYLQSQRPALLAGIDKGKAETAAGHFKEAVAAYEGVIARIRAAPHDVAELKALLQRATEGRRLARAKWAEMIEVRLSDLSSKAEAARRAGKLDDAEKLCRQVLAEFKAAAVTTPGTKQIAESVGALLAKIEEDQRAEARRLAELRERQRKEAQAQRIREENARLALWRELYELVEQVHDEVAATQGAMPRLRSLERELAEAHAGLPSAEESKAAVAASKAAELALLSLRNYVRAREEVGEALTEVLADDDSPDVKLKKAKLKLRRTKLSRDLEAFVGDYLFLLSSAGRESRFVPADLARRGRDARRQRDLCPWCQGTGFMPCTHCLVRGRPTGKAQCPACKGKGHVPCPVCGGAGSSLCSRCKGKGRIYAGKRTGRRFSRDVYRTCPVCQGKGYTHRVGGSVRPGRCPKCGGHLPKGTITCRQCRGTGLYGVCPVCKGTKQVPCTHCDAYARLKAKKPPPSTGPAKGAPHTAPASAPGH